MKGKDEAVSAAEFAAFAAWVAGPAQARLEINLKVYDVWLLLSNLQLSLTHPGMNEGLRNVLRELAHDLEGLIAAFAPPEIAALAAAGWDRSRDVPIGER